MPPYQELGKFDGRPATYEPQCMDIWEDVKKHRMQKRLEQKKKVSCCCVFCTAFVLVLALFIVVLFFVKCDLVCDLGTTYYADPLDQQYTIGSNADQLGKLIIDNKRGEVIFNPATSYGTDNYVTPTVGNINTRVIAEAAFASSELRENVVPPETLTDNECTLKYNEYGTGTKDRCFCRLADIYVSYGTTDVSTLDVEISNEYNDIIFSKRQDSDSTYTLKSLKVENLNGHIRLRDLTTVKADSVEFVMLNPDGISSGLNGILEGNDVRISEGSTLIANTVSISTESPRGDVEITGTIKTKSLTVTLDQSVSGTMKTLRNGAYYTCADPFSATCGEETTYSKSKDNLITINSSVYKMASADDYPNIRVRGDTGMIKVNLFDKTRYGEFKLKIPCAEIQAKYVLIYDDTDTTATALETEVFHFKDKFGDTISLSKNGVCDYGTSGRTYADDVAKCRDSTSVTPDDVLCVAVTYEAKTSNKIWVYEE